ncbi:MAG: CopG family transcriptional regulator [Actinomycetota bacterium]|nr:CopG family transcriptional regulator [Actinomycetota bacterium]
MKKTMMYLPDDLHRFLVRESAERGVSMAEIAREAIGEYRAQREEQVHRGVQAIFGVLADDDEATDLALTIDQTLAEYFGEGGAFEVGG